MFFDRILTALLLIQNYDVLKSDIVKPKTSSSSCQKCHSLSSDGRINVHLVPHSHDDVGWLKTFDQYYYGTEKFDTHADAGVRFILDSVIQALKTNLNRRFIQVETAFFWKWWNHQTKNTKQEVKNLVASGQLEIINGAWSMNDEATTNYQSIIDQFTWGFLVLNHSLGACGIPKIGWQIDPFGHSREHASLLKQMGFLALVLGRIDYKDKENRIRNKNLEFFWKSSRNLENSNIFTTIFPNSYNYESGFCFDVICNDRISDKYSERKEQIQDFAEILDNYKTYFKTPNILIPMGGDFTYQIAELNFANTDKLIKGFDNHPDYKLFYSTPSCYVKAVQEVLTNNSSITLTTKADDFFPYASSQSSYWTGFFTSRPTLKRFERMGNNFFQSAKQLMAFSRIEGTDYDKYINSLRSVMGMLQHHDAITGTEKQAVAEDYVKLLHKAIKNIEKPLSNVIGHLLAKSEDVNLKFSTCLLTNVSICKESKKNKFLVAVYNPLSRSVRPYIRLPVDDVNYKITGDTFGQLREQKYDVFDTIHSFDYIKEKIKPSRKELVFQPSSIPPLGIKLYYFEKISEEQNRYYPFTKFEKIEENNFGAEKTFFTVNSEGKLTSITMNGIMLEVEQVFLYYSSLASGAYAFKPENTKPMSTKIHVKYAKGTLVEELIQYLSPEVTQIIRVYKEEQYIEFDWLVGGLLNVDFGKEVVTKFKIKNFTNHGIFYTDSNGREQIRRIRNKRKDYLYDHTKQPVASNYYPVTSKIVIRDEEKKLQVAVLNDRAQGGSSLEEGSIELMIHRKLITDDGFGVSEILDEEEYGKGLFVRGQHYVTFGSTEKNIDTDKSTTAFEKDLSHRKLFEPLVLFGDVSSTNLDSVDKVKKLLNFKFDGLSLSLKGNVKILTFEPWIDCYLLRLEHVMEKDESLSLSSPTIINLNKLFTFFNITEIAETSLGGFFLEDMKEVVWRKVGAMPIFPLENPLLITLKPMQIRTFLIKTNKNNFGGFKDGDDESYSLDNGNILKSNFVIFILITLYYWLC